MVVAMHAVEPVCPRCNQRVRGSIELQADLVDLQRAAAELVGRLADARAARIILETECSSVLRQLSALDAELRGEHLVCPDGLH